jgi:hypothetical protein
MRRLDRAGQRFNMLTAIKPVEGLPRSVWECRCDCGAVTRVRACNLISGAVKSCGCLLHRVRNPHYGTREYKSYQMARQRCNNPKYDRYAGWGGRGIKFLFESFEDFFAELGPRPPGTSLDKINNDGNYEPGNVRWATPHEQQMNRRKKAA